MCTNIDSLLNKRAELSHLLLQKDIDVFILCEVLPKFVKYQVQPSEISFENYDCFTNCFTDNVHRGVAIYAKKRLSAQQVCLAINDAKAKESVWVEVKLMEGDNLLIGGIYRPPSNTAEEDKRLYETMLRQIEGRSHVLLAGDFNQPDIDWKNETTPASMNNPATVFMEKFVRNSFLYQHIKEPTHFRPQQNSTLIDLVFSSEESMVKNVQHESPIGKSHHQCIYFDFVCYAKCESNKGRIYNFKKADFDLMRHLVKNENLMDLIKEMNTEETWSCISECILEAVDKSVPKIYQNLNSKSGKQQRKKPEWWTEKSGTKVKLKGEAYRKWLRTQEDEDWNSYVKLRNQSKSECRKADREYQKGIAKDSKKNPKRFYAYTNGKMKVREGIGDLVDKDGNKITTNDEKAETLNSFFCSVFTSERLEDLPKCENRNPEIELENIDFTKEQVLKKLKDIDSSKSGGPDNITAAVLKNLANELAEPVAELFNRSMKEGKLPSVWKEANVVPLFKKRRKN